MSEQSGTYGSPSPLIRAGDLSLPGAARAYATAGVAIFPCMARGKRPLTPNGFKDATADLGRVSSWWRQWPRANIGIATGHCYDVLDIDIHRDGTGYPAFERARRAGLVRGWAHLVRTPSGGLHVYYPADPERPQVSWSIAEEHMDFRGLGGYVIAPPSVLESNGELGHYRVASSSLAPAHPIDGAALRDFLRPPPPLTLGRPDEVRRNGPDVGKLAAWLEQQGEGNRNKALYWAACRCAEHGVTKASALHELAPSAERTGLDGREITATIGSAYRRLQPGTYGVDQHPGTTPEGEGLGR